MCTSQLFLELVTVDNVNFNHLKRNLYCSETERRVCERNLDNNSSVCYVRFKEKVTKPIDSVKGFPHDAG